MADIRSFKEFIKKQYEDTLEKALSVFVAENPSDLDLSSYHVSNPDEAELVDMKIYRVDVSDSAGDEVRFDVIVIAEITIHERKRRSDKESDDKEQWFRIPCSANVDADGFRDFTDTLSDGLVPIIAKENFDAVAEAFLAEYYPEALTAPMPVDIVEEKPPKPSIQNRIAKSKEQGNKEKPIEKTQPSQKKKRDEPEL